MDSKQEFYSHLIKEYPNTETAKVIADNLDCEYYGLCQSFLDIALNAPKFIDENGSLAGVFQYADIDIAKEKALAFLTKFSINDVDEFFDILDKQYPFSSSPDDTRQKSAMIKSDNANYRGYIGTFYPLTHISDDVYRNIVDDIKKVLQKE